MNILYRYALDKNNILKDVFELDRIAVDFGSVFKCVGCGKEVIAKLGTKNAKHFAHKIVTVNCGYETYLHQLSKKIFYDEYRKCLNSKEPFYLIRKENVICNHFENIYGYKCFYSVEKNHDLTEHFDRINLETNYNNFIPDVLLESSKHKTVLFIEFAVTHKCEEEKLKSGIRIIEYSVESEIDFKIIKAHKLYDTNRKISLYNFKVKNEKKSFCEGKCSEKINVFVVYKSKKSILLELLPYIDVKKQLKGTVTYYEVLGKASDREYQISLYRQQVREAHFKGVPIKNCFLCRYHGGDGVENAIFCKIAKQSVPSNEAVECAKYRTFSNMDECIEQDKKNDEYTQKKGANYMIHRFFSQFY